MNIQHVGECHQLSVYRVRELVVSRRVTSHASHAFHHTGRHFLFLPNESGSSLRQEQDEEQSIPTPDVTRRAYSCSIGYDNKHVFQLSMGCVSKILHRRTPPPPHPSHGVDQSLARLVALGRLRVENLKQKASLGLEVWGPPTKLFRLHSRHTATSVPSSLHQHD